MKKISNEVVSNCIGILLMSLFIAILFYMHHLFMSGINPLFSNIFVLVSLGLMFFIPIYFIIKNRRKSVISHILSFAIALIIGLFLGNYMVFDIIFG